MATFIHEKSRGDSAMSLHNLFIPELKRGTFTSARREIRDI